MLNFKSQIAILLCSVAILLSGCNSGENCEIADTESLLTPYYRTGLNNEIPKSQIDKIAILLWPEMTSNTSTLIHALNAFAGPHEPSGGDDTSLFSCQDFLDEILTAEGRTGKPRIMSTRYGARYFLGAMRTDGEAHHAQVVSFLALSGVSPQNELVLQGKSLRVKDLIVDCHNMFSLNGELEWSALTTCIHPLNRCHVENRFHERITYDEIALTLVCIASAETGELS